MVASRRDVKTMAVLLKCGADIHYGQPLPYDALLMNMNEDMAYVIQLLVMSGLHLDVSLRLLSEELLSELQESKELCEWLEYRLHNPLSLKQRCRFVIRNCLKDISEGTSVLEYFKDLPVPMLIRRFLELQDGI